jgi:2-polyprenyl-3-methyl-5-hydroxy-6-metoxy-1,4-benzoquinol methylase
MMDEMAGIAAVYREPLEGDWPEADLEYLGKCPVCGSEARSMAYSGLKDRIFFNAPGTWTSWRCGNCGVAYLDPRPTLRSIGRAYESYYTHEAVASAPKSQAVIASAIRKLKQMTKNSYFNKKFHYRFSSNLPFGWLAFALQPARSFRAAAFIRHLPGPAVDSGRLLDIGCGNGSFLQFARDELGYQAEGLEIDVAARQVAEARGLKIHAGLIPGSGLVQGQYDQITLSHVVEHLHDPKGALAEALLLLKPGGRIWIQVPNISATSLKRFGISSILLDAPRHLVMFDAGSLATLLRDVGFESVRALDPGRTIASVAFQPSWLVERGMDPFHTPLSVIPKEVKAAEAAMYNHPAWSPATFDTVTVIANRPASDGL